MKEQQFDWSAHQGGQAALALAALHSLAMSAAARPGPREAAAGMLDVFSRRLAMRKGVVGSASPVSGAPEPLALHGMGEEEFVDMFTRARSERGPALFEGSGTVLHRAPGPAGAPSSGGSDARPRREGISFFFVPLRAQGEGAAFVAVDALFPEWVDPAEDLRLLATGSFMFGPLLTGEAGGDRLPEPGGGGSSLGKVLQRHIAAWIEPMDASRRLLKSDIYGRFIAEVEKILIAAALKKTGQVRTEAARFLGMNRNTLSKKIVRYGLKARGE